MTSQIGTVRGSESWQHLSDNKVYVICVSFSAPSEVHVTFRRNSIGSDGCWRPLQSSVARQSLPPSFFLRSKERDGGCVHHDFSDFFVLRGHWAFYGPDGVFGFGRLLSAPMGPPPAFYGAFSPRLRTREYVCLRDLAFVWSCRRTDGQLPTLV